MDAIFITSKNSKTSGRNRLLLNLLEKIDLKISDNMLLFQILAYNIHGKIKKSYTKILNLKFQLRHRMKN